ncbi:MAG: hypothetical protein V3U68_05425 [Bacteroidota bacterium]
MKPLNRFYHVLLVILLIPVLAFSHGEGRDHRANRMLSSLNLSEEQWDAVRPLRFDLEKKLISLNEKIALARLELRQLLHAKTLDQSSIARKMGEISQLLLQKKTLRLGNWFEIQQLLTPEQQEKWKHALRMEMAGKTGPRGGVRHEPKERWREKMRERRFRNRFD